MDIGNHGRIWWGGGGWGVAARIIPYLYIIVCACVISWSDNILPRLFSHVLIHWLIDGRGLINTGSTLVFFTQSSYHVDLLIVWLTVKCFLKSFNWCFYVWLIDCWLCSIGFFTMLASCWPVSRLLLSLQHLTGHPGLSPLHSSHTARQTYPRLTPHFINPYRYPYYW